MIKVQAHNQYIRYANEFKKKLISYFYCSCCVVALPRFYLFVLILRESIYGRACSFSRSNSNSNSSVFHILKRHVPGFCFFISSFFLVKILFLIKQCCWCVRTFVCDTPLFYFFCYYNNNNIWLGGVF